MKELTAIDAYIGSMTAMAMAEALLDASGVRGNCGSYTKRSLSTREQGQKFAKLEADKLASNFEAWSSWSNGHETIQFSMDCIAGYKEAARTGLDRFSAWSNPQFRKQKALLLLEVRRLRNDSKWLMALALSLSGEDKSALFFAALTGPTKTMFKEWAETLAS